ncbi:hypothetical protein BCL79_0274 [Stenotrophomonas rhizophila]|uniref:Uncharacterized protein n=1 Tax=Stenotrophomonas rhizophila TaxID=216778 RepID=A0A498CQK8_9GAMM|nr:hypothetical protein BCL79_0274 [Stenotrophomonas rhizophila]
MAKAGCNGDGRNDLCWNGRSPYCRNGFDGFG